MKTFQIKVTVVPKPHEGEHPKSLAKFYRHSTVKEDGIHLLESPVVDSLLFELKCQCYEIRMMGLAVAIIDAEEQNEKVVEVAHRTGYCGWIGTACPLSTGKEKESP